MRPEWRLAMRNSSEESFYSDELQRNQALRGTSTGRGAGVVAFCTDEVVARNSEQLIEIHDFCHRFSSQLPFLGSRSWPRIGDVGSATTHQ